MIEGVIPPFSVFTSRPASLAGREVSLKYVTVFLDIHLLEMTDLFRYNNYVAGGFTTEFPRTFIVISFNYPVM